MAHLQHVGLTMSRRFGRNQRRRAREAIAQLEQQGEKLTIDLQGAQRKAEGISRDRGRILSKVALLETQLEAVRKVFGDTIVLPPVEQFLDSKELRDIVEMGMMRTRPLAWTDRLEPFSTRDLTATESVLQSFQAMTLDIIEAGVDLMPKDGLMAVPHAYLRTRSSPDLYYSVKLDSLAMLHRPEVINRLTHMLATAFADELERLFPKRPHRR